jgi:uncharacterized protein (TIGR02466 family)
MSISFDDLTGGKIKQAPPQIQQPQQAQDELLSLFPTPVLIAQYPLPYEKELEYIRNLECRRENKGGDNTNKIHYNRQSQNTFVLDEPELANVREWIKSKIYKFGREIMLSKDELVITQSWINKSGKGESHHEHVHPNSMISGVWYPVINEQLPPIQFRSRAQRDISLSNDKYNNFNSATFLLPMKMGELIIFPSNLTHSVPANQSDTERISLSFNTWVKGSLGDINSLTYLPLDRCV